MSVKNYRFFDVGSFGAIRIKRLILFYCLKDILTVSRNCLRLIARNSLKSFFRIHPIHKTKTSLISVECGQPQKKKARIFRGKISGIKTRLNSSYYTFDSERYLMIKDFQGYTRLWPGNAPYDYIYILANTDKYGGGARL